MGPTCLNYSINSAFWSTSFLFLCSFYILFLRLLGRFPTGMTHPSFLSIFAANILSCSTRRWLQAQIFSGLFHGFKQHSNSGLIQCKGIRRWKDSRANWRTKTRGGQGEGFPKRTSVLELVNEVLMHTLAFFFLKFVSKFSGVELRYRELEKKNEWFLGAECCSWMVSTWACVSGCLYTGACLEFPKRKRMIPKQCSREFNAIFN